MLRLGIGVCVDGSGLDAILRCCLANSSSQVLAVCMTSNERITDRAISPRLAIKIDVNGRVNFDVLLLAKEAFSLLVQEAYRDARLGMTGRTRDGRRDMVKCAKS